MARPGLETIELSLAEAGGELVPAIEAAQYARLIDHEETVAPAEARSIESFVEAFGAAAESWDELVARERGVWLARLGDHLETLEAHGLHVHVGTLQRPFAVGERTLALPVAVLTIGRSALPTRQVLVPARLALEQDTSLH